jgi:hypothetical protein
VGTGPDKAGVGVAEKLGEKVVKERRVTAPFLFERPRTPLCGVPSLFRSSPVKGLLLALSLLVNRKKANNIPTRQGEVRRHPHNIGDVVSLKQDACG